MKEKILELLKGMTSDSKKESYKCEKELCKILTEVCNKLQKIEKATYSINYYPDEITSIDSDNVYVGINQLPEEIWCNDGDDNFKISWLDIDPIKHFEDCKNKSISGKQYTIERVEYSLNKHKEELEQLKKLSFDDLIIY